MELFTRHSSGKHKQVIPEINLIALMWTDIGSQIPCDYCLRFSKGEMCWVIKLNCNPSALEDWDMRVDG